MIALMLTRILDASAIDMNNAISDALYADLARMDVMQHGLAPFGATAYKVKASASRENFSCESYRFVYTIQYGVIKDNEVFQAQGKPVTYQTETLPQFNGI